MSTSDQDGGTSPATTGGAGRPGDTAQGEPGEVPMAAAVDRRTVRRAPRYGRFVLLALALSAVAAYLLSGVPPSDVAISRGQVLDRGTLFLIIFATLGTAAAVLGAAVALILDRRSLRRRARRMRDLPR